MTVEITHKKSIKLTHIVETAEILFKRFGIKRVTVEEICRKANVSKMTFYKYFSNKIELVKYIWNEWYDMAFGRYDEINAMNIPVTEKLPLMIQWKMELISDMSEEFIEEYFHVDPELEKFIQDYLQKSLRRFMDYIICWQKNGDIRPEIRPEFLIAVIDKLQELFGDENLKKLYTSNTEFIHELHKLFFYGIVPRDVSEQK